MYNDYRAAGFRIFGLHPIVGNHCGCGDAKCHATGKHPIATNWQRTPAWSDEQVETMEESGQFETGFGVLLAGHLVVDIDPRNGGWDGYKALTDRLGFDCRDKAGFVVDTGGGGQHIYFTAPPDLSLVGKLPDYIGIDFKSSGFVVGCGSTHANGQHYELERGDPSNVGKAPKKLIKLLKRKHTHRTKVDGVQVDIAETDIKDMLAVISPDIDYHDWVTIGMAIHDATNGAGIHLFDDWSAGGSKYAGSADIDRKWHSFGKAANPVTIGTLIHLAQERGYRQAVTFIPDIPIETSSIAVDLTRPPGFVGELAQWINDQCRFPREHLAAAAAIHSVGNIGGLKYIDGEYGATSNLFTFCLAGSATGKEAVQQAVHDIHRAAGMTSSYHGTIKSEQEIVRGLIASPASTYVIDELGIFLAKIVNATKRGGASYLEGVIGLLMSAYSKADGRLPLGHDVKIDAKKMISTEVAALVKAKEENEVYDGARLDELMYLLAEIDGGLPRPFLSLLGYTTPVTFEGMVDYQQATSGFIGRALIVNEAETNPRMKTGFNRRSMPAKMEMRLTGIYAGSQRDLIREAIPTEAGAVELLNALEADLYGLAENQKEVGLEALARRGFEQILKVSLALAIPQRLRTVEDVEWAAEYVKRDLAFKSNLTAANMAEEHRQNGEALLRKILHLLDAKVGMSPGVLRNRLRGFDPNDVDQAVDKLVDKKSVIRTIRNNSRGKPTVTLNLASE